MLALNAFKFHRLHGGFDGLPADAFVLRDYLRTFMFPENAPRRIPDSTPAVFKFLSFQHAANKIAKFAIARSAIGATAYQTAGHNESATAIHRGNLAALRSFLEMDCACT